MLQKLLTRLTLTAGLAGSLAAASFNNTGSISIPNSGVANPYPSEISVSGLGNSITSLVVKLVDFSHEDIEDVDILLVSPTGRAMLIFSDVGNGEIRGRNYTLSDAGAANFSTSGGPASGTYKPTDNTACKENLTSPAPATGYNPGPCGTATFASVYNGTDPNGVWKLFVVDDNGSDRGKIDDGWVLEITADSRIGGSEVPEPSTWALCAMGVAAVVRAKMRK